MTSSKNLPIRFICLMCLTLLGNFELRLVQPRLLLLYSNVIHLSGAHLNKNLCLLLCPTSDSALNSDPIVSCSVERNSVAEAEAAYSSPSLASSSTAARRQIYRSLELLCWLDSEQKWKVRPRIALRSFPVFQSGWYYKQMSPSSKMWRQWQARSRIKS